MRGRFRTAGRPGVGRALEWGTLLLDQLGVDATGELSRRSLWGLLPRSPARGTVEPLLALSFDLDYQADTDALPELVDLVNRVGARMSVVAIGKLVERDPEPYRRAIASGHEIVNHTWSHPDNPALNPDREFWHLETPELATEIGEAQAVFERELGVRPTGFRSPHFKDTPRMLQALAAFPEITYVSSALASKTPLGIPYHPRAATTGGIESLYFSSESAAENSELLMIPLTPCPEHRWSPFCSYHAIRRPADPTRGSGMHDLAEWTATWSEMLRRARPDNFASVYFDPMDVMRDGETAKAFERMLREAVEEGWTVTTLAEVERRWRPLLRDQAPP